jgi:hypothetical protein
MKLLSAVIYLGASKMEAWVEDSWGRKRNMKVRWLARGASNVPPANVLELLEQEVGNQQGEELKAHRGARLPTVRSKK